MSIKAFIESNGEDAINTRLPVPYIESVEVYDNHIDIVTSIYIPVAKQDYAFDEGAEYLETFDNLQVCMMMLMDRNSFTPACGIAPEFTSNRFENLSTTAWTDYTKHNTSPIRYFYGENPTLLSQPTLGSEYTEIVTNFTFDPSAADFDYLLSVLEYSQPYLFEDYLLPPDSAGVQSAATWASIVNYVEDKIPSFSYDDPTAARDSEYRTVLIELINQAISANDYSLVIRLFGHVTYPAQEFPTPSIADGYIPNMKIIRAHARTVIFTKHFSDYRASIADVLQKSDGSVILKLSSIDTLQFDEITPAIYGREQRLGIKNMGFVAFTAPWFNLRDRQIEDVHQEIFDAVIDNSSELVYWETSISETNHVLVIKDDNIAKDPSVVYIDSNGKTYNEAMRSLDGAYYEVGATPYNSIVSSMIASADSAAISEDTMLSFQYVMSQTNRDPTDTLSIINKYRKSFPDKSTVTAAGQFYNAFAEILYNTNKELQRGTELRKALITNPVVKDWRTSIYGDPQRGSHVGDDYTEAYYNVFSLENALWSRYTEVTGIDQYEEEITRVTDSEPESVGSANPLYTTTGLDSGNHSYDTYTHVGGQWNYNFIDHGFMFFNYEKAIKKTCFAARYLNIVAFEKYFGGSVFNSLFIMKKCYLKAYFGDPDDAYDIGTTTVDDPVWPIGTMELVFPDLSRQWTLQSTSFYNTSNTIEWTAGTDNALNVDKFDVYVDNSLGSLPDGMIAGDGPAAETRLANEFGGADAMVNSREYSFLALRGFSPITTQDGVDPFHVDSTFYDEEPLKYRMACIEFQKCDAYDAYEGRNSHSINSSGVSEEVEEHTRGGAFTAAILVQDTTHQILLNMYEKLQSTLDEFNDYYDAASDTCSFNETTGFFNQFFIDTVLNNWPESADAPYYKSVVELIIFEDIFFGVYGGDSTKILEQIKEITYSISPNTGTLAGIEQVKTRFGFLEDTIKEIVDEYGEEVITVGHVYGHSPYYDEDYEAAETKFNEEVESTAARQRDTSTTALLHRDSYYEAIVYTPDAGYDNYPLYPADLTITTSQYTVPDPPPQDLVEDMDVTDGLNTFVEDLLEGADLRNDLLGVMVDMLADIMSELESRLGFDSWHGYTTDAIDILDIAAGRVGSTFPDMDDLGSYVDPYGNMGESAAYDMLYVLENFDMVADVMVNAFDALNSMDAGDVAGILSGDMAAMFGPGGIYSHSASVADYFDSNTLNLQNLVSIQVNMSMVSNYASAGVQNINWL